MAAVDPHQESKVASALMSSWDWKWCKPLFAYFPSTSGQNLKPKVKLSTSQSFANSNYMNLEIWILEVPLNYTDYCTTRKYESNTFIAWWHISHQSREITKMIIVFSFLEKKEKKKADSMSLFSGPCNSLKQHKCPLTYTKERAHGYTMTIHGFFQEVFELLDLYFRSLFDNQWSLENRITNFS